MTKRKKSKKMMTLNRWLDWIFIAGLVGIPIGVTVSILGYGSQLTMISAVWMGWSVLTYFVLNIKDIMEEIRENGKRGEEC